MRIAQLNIKGFRGIESGAINFTRHSVLLGSNNVGKSAIIDALALLLGRNKLVRDLDEYDFYGGNPSASDRIFIEGVITDFPNNDVESNPNWFNSNRAFDFWLDSKTNEINKEKSDRYNRLCTKIIFAARFDLDLLEVETLRYFYKGEEAPFENPNLCRVSLSYLKELGFYLLPTNRTWWKTFSFSSQLFKQVLKTQDAIPSDSIIELKDEVKNLQNVLKDENTFSEVLDRVHNELIGFIGEDYDDLKFRITRGDIDSILKSLTPFLTSVEEVELPVDVHGSGLLSLQILLLLLEFGRARHHKEKSFILAAEEPELHLQPGIHRRLVARIRGVSDQTIATTHSPEIASYYKPKEITIIQNNSGKLKAYPLHDNEVIPQENALMRLFTLFRAELCQALMQKILIIPEGKTDYIWFKNLIKGTITAEGWENGNESSKSIYGLGILPTQSSNVSQIYDQFSQFVPTTVPLVDGDQAGLRYIKRLKELDSPPPLILKLQSGFEIENIISWFIEPNTDGDWNELETRFNHQFSKNKSALIQFIKDNKTKWDQIEQISEIIARNDKYVKKANYFLNSLIRVCLKQNSSSNVWREVDEQSTNKTIVREFTSTNYE